jgi:hypothetical protein
MCHIDRFSATSRGARRRGRGANGGGLHAAEERKMGHPRGHAVQRGVAVDVGALAAPLDGVDVMGLMGS